MSLNVLCIDDDREFIVHLQLEFESHHRIIAANNMKAGIDAIGDNDIDAVLLDIGFKGMDGITGLKLILEQHPHLPVIMLTAYKDPKSIIESIRSGAYDYICKPFDTDELLSVLEKVEKQKTLQEHNLALHATLKGSNGKRSIVGRSVKLRRVIEQAKMVRGHNANVLIEGKSGTGKELLARYIHNLEDDASRPFIAINCAAIPENLIESELFGHEKGSFTGAVARKIGKFELADDGDLFLDEISSLRPELQAKILRTLQEGTFCRIGGNKQLHSKFRVIAATNSDLEEMIEDKAFRMDLFHRLRVVHLHIPALAERKEDIPDLVETFLVKHSRGTKVKSMTSDAVELLTEYDWPGNVRELENVVQSMIIMTPVDEIAADDLPRWLTEKAASGPSSPQKHCYLNFDKLPYSTLKDFTRNMERRFIEHILKRNEGDRQRTAKDLKIARSTFYIKLRELGIE